MRAQIRLQNGLDGGTTNGAESTVASDGDIARA
jgi:hypothetical protein